MILRLLWHPLRQRRNMKLRIPWFLVALAIMAAIGGVEKVFADTLQWDTPYGQIHLNLQSSESLVGYDGILKQAIGGISLPVYTDPKGIVTLHLGAGAPWPVGNQSTIQPIFMMGHNLLKEIPGMAQYRNFQINVFGRWATNQGKAGAGIAGSYSFAMPSPATEPAPPPATVSMPIPAPPTPPQEPILSNPPAVP